MVGIPRSGSARMSVQDPPEPMFTIDRNRCSGCFGIRTVRRWGDVCHNASLRAATSGVRARGYDRRSEVDPVGSARAYCPPDRRTMGLADLPTGAGETVRRLPSSGLVRRPPRRLRGPGAYGHRECGILLDSPDGRFKLIDFAPDSRRHRRRGVLGVDLFGPYPALARGDPVRPDPRYAMGVVYRAPAASLTAWRFWPQTWPYFLADISTGPVGLHLERSWPPSVRVMAARRR